MSTLSSPVPRVAGPPVRRVRRSLFVEATRWPLATAGALAAAMVLWPTYSNDSLWLGPGIVLIALISWHSLVAGRRLPWIPGLTLVTAALQWVIAPWVTYHIGPSFTRYEMVVPAQEYFAFAVPALAAFAAGMFAVLRREGRAAPPVAKTAVATTRRFRVTCDAMVIGGAVAQLALVPLLGGGGLAFLVLLVANLGFVGALALLLAHAPRWPLRLLFVLGVQGLVAAGNGMFHDLVLWTAYSCLTLIYAYRLRTSTIAALVGGALGLVMILNVVKGEFRKTIAGTSEGLFGRAALLSDNLLESAGDPEAAYEGSGLKFNVTRLNQGWIIARVLYWVPQREPYARGETIRATVRATLLPRVLAPDKLEIGGRTYFERFTGMALGTASMDLSLAGEMYANFGYWGALVGIFVFGGLLALVYRLFLRWSYRSRLWWAWAPYVLLYSSKAENSIAEVTNHVFKSSIVMIAVISIVPAWAMLRRPLRARLARAFHEAPPAESVGR